MNYCECGEIVYERDDRCSSCGAKNEQAKSKDRQLRLFNKQLSKNLMLFEKRILNN
jgi:hypothetical protein